jgi:hypothetical protein
VLRGTHEDLVNPGPVTGVVGKFVSRIIKSQKGKREGEEKRERKDSHQLFQILNRSQNAVVST